MDRMTNGSGAASALDTVLTGESQKMMYTHTATVMAKYGGLKKELEALETAVTGHRRKIETILRTSRRKLDPFYLQFDPTSKSNMEDLAMYRFMDTIGGGLLNFMTTSSSRLQLIESYCGLVLPVLQKKSTELSSVVLAEESGSELLNISLSEFSNTVMGFERMLASVYVGTRDQYKRLRKKFLGASAAPEKDDMENDLLAQLFGQRPPKADISGPAVALIEDNCVLTQLLLDIEENLPRYYEKTSPILKRGKITGNTKSTKVLDPGEIEDWAGTLIAISNNTFWNYVKEPNELTQMLLNAITEFQVEYNSIAKALYELVLKANLHNGEGRRIIEDPNVLVKNFNRINFLSIRPSAEDIAPRNKMDQDIAVARTKLFKNLYETLTALTGMDRGDSETEAFAIEKLKEAIELKKEIVEIMRTEAQKNLARNIADDNEFYVGKSGNLGSLSSEREAAPKITYEDVIGKSFVTAKQHVEEVIKVASHPNLMRLSAPRGNVKSNLLFIGPYGCGKTEIARAIGGDKRIIGFNVATVDLLTAFMHESPKNVKRMYECAKDLRKGSRYSKPVAILMDEFDRLFDSGEGVNRAYDGGRMTGTVQEMMDGVVDYEGVFLVGMTNVPKAIPEAILRRFKYVDVVGQLDAEERAKLFKMFLERGLPVASDVTQESYLKWAEMLDHAPGDVIGKVADEIHFKYMHEIVNRDSAAIAKIERTLAKRLRDRSSKKQDHEYLKKLLTAHGHIAAAEITEALETVIKQPQVKMQITKAKQTYKDAKEILDGLSVVGDAGLGFHSQGKKSQIWGK